MAGYIPEQIVRRWEYYKKLGKFPESKVEFLEKIPVAPQEEVKDSVASLDENAPKNESTVSVQETTVQNAEVQAVEVQDSAVNDVNQKSESPKIEEKPKRRRRKTNPDGSVEDADGDGIPDSQER